MKSPSRQEKGVKGTLKCMKIGECEGPRCKWRRDSPFLCPNSKNSYTNNFPLEVAHFFFLGHSEFLFWCCGGAFEN